MDEQSQQELLRELKTTLEATWDDVATLTGIPARTLKSYRLPPSSHGYRGMDKFVRKAVADVLKEVHRKKKKGV